MKRSGIISLGMAVLMATFTACTTDEPQSDIDALELEMDAALEVTYESIDQMVEIGFDFIDSPQRTDETGLGTCAVVSNNPETKIITIDFGDGCVGRLGNTVKGKIEIEYNDRAYVPGAYRIITFVDFYFNDIKVEGTRTITNTSASESERQFTVTLEGGKLDFGNGVFATRDAVWVRTWFIGDGIVTLSGGADGVNINGIDYDVTVSTETPLTFTRECLQLLPVSGVKEIQVGEREASIDYGDGECDRIVEITINGRTIVKVISPRKGRS